MNVPGPNGPPPPGRSTSTWVYVLIIVGALGACCVSGFVGLMLFGFGSAASLASPVVGAPPGGGGTWKPAGEVARGTGFTRALEGRWLYQSGGSVDAVVARSGATAWVQTNTSGTLYDFTFEGSDYTFQWASAVTLYGGTSRSSCVEKGSWSLSGRELTLEPSEQRCTYVATTGLSQDKEDEDLSARRYQLTDIELETIPAAGVPLERFSGLELAGPAAKWDVSRERLELDLQPL